MSQSTTLVSTFELLQQFQTIITSIDARNLNCKVLIEPIDYIQLIKSNTAFRIALFETYSWMKNEFEKQIIRRDKAFQHEDWTCEMSFAQTILMYLYH
jgi:hypothetical protein